MTDVMSADRWARVKEAFQQALELDDRDRAPFVARTCGADETVRAEVERLLAAHAAAAAAEFIDRPPAGMAGRRIGRYEIGRLLGAGGMGEVYLARDVELGREVALKIGRSEGDDARLRREAQHASQLNHPNICIIHEMGSFEGRFYIVMEYVEGQPLSALSRPEGLPLDSVVQYGAQIAAALDHAHRHGVVHGDLKTANIVITPDGRAKVLDFGLARRLPAERVKALTQSQATMADGIVAGTLSYMAPELLRGQQADAGSDIWALGVLLYELAAGTRPFGGTTGFELSAAILREPPLALPAHVPTPLQALIGQCLAKDPRTRYRLASDIRSALETLREPAAPRMGPSRASRFLRSVRRHLAAATVGLLVVAAAGAVGWRTWQAPRDPVAIGSSGRPTIAIIAFDNLTSGDEASWLSKGVQSMLLTGLAQASNLSVISNQRLHEVSQATGGVALESLDRVQASDIARRAGAGAAVVGSIAKSGTTIRIDAQVEDLSNGRVLAATSVSGSDVFAIVDELAVRIRDGIGVRASGDVRSITAVSSTSLEAYRLYSTGVEAFENQRLDEAHTLLERAVAIDPMFADAYLELALVSGPRGHPADRLGLLQKAAANSGRLSEPRRLLMTAELARDERRYTDAAKALDDLRAKFPEMDAISVMAGQLYPPTGPLPNQEKLLAITRAVVAASPSSGLARNGYAYALLYEDRFDEAIRELETYVRLAPREPAPHDSLGDAYLAMGLADKSIEAYGRALTIDPKFFPGGRARVLGIVGRLDEAVASDGIQLPLQAVMLARVGRYRDAQRTVEAAVRTAEGDGSLDELGPLHLVSALLAIERRDYASAIGECQHADRIMAQRSRDLLRFTLALKDLLCGVAELRSGRPGAARSRLDSQQQLYESMRQTNQWWRDALAGEIAFAAGDLDAAAGAFARAHPPTKLFSARRSEAVLSNDLIFRDGLARVAQARGDLKGAIEIYRSLLVYGLEQKWVALFEPRYVLEIARLLERVGDQPAARAEYQRFLQLWKRADTDLPELAAAQRALVRRAPGGG